MIGNMDVVEYVTHIVGQIVEELKEEQHDENGTAHMLCCHVD